MSLIRRQEEIENTILFKKVFGCLIGGSIGDAMGGPVEMVHYKAIRRVFGKITGLLEYKPPPGAGYTQRGGAGYAKRAGIYTDDTRLKHLLCQAIMDKGGRITADDFAETWRQKMNPNEFFFTVQSAFYKIALTDIPSREAGRGNVPDSSCPMFVSPMGIINSADPERAWLETLDIASLTHDGYSQESAAVVGAAVAEAMNTEATIDSIVNASIKYAGKDSKVAPRVREAINLAKRCSNASDFTEKFYKKFLIPYPMPAYRKVGEDVSICIDPLEDVPVALAIFYIEKGTPKGVIVEATNFGRNCDTIACIAGAIAGAYKGIDAIPGDWVKISLEANPEPNQKEIALRLTNVILKIREQLSGTLANLDRLLNR